MGSQTAKIGTCTIAGGTAVSNILTNKTLKMARGLLIETAEDAFTGTISLHGSLSESGTPKPVTVGGSAVTLTANSVIQIDVSGLCAIQIKSSGNEGDVCAFDVYAILEPGVG